MTKYCIVQRDLELNAKQEVIAVRDIWDATPEGIGCSRKVLEEMAKVLNLHSTDAATDYIVCDGSFGKIVAKFRTERIAC